MPQWQHAMLDFIVDSVITFTQDSVSLPSNGWEPWLQTAPTDGCADIFGFYYKPPKPNTTVIQIAKALVPLINRMFLKGLTLDIDAESIARLKKVDGHPKKYGELTV